MIYIAPKSTMFLWRICLGDRKGFPELSYFVSRGT